MHHELTAYIRYSGLDNQLSYWRLASGIEAEFIVDDVRVAIEAKAVRKVQTDHLKGMRNLVEDHPRVKKRILASLEPRRRVTEDGILILPAREFAKALWAGEIL